MTNSNKAAVFFSNRPVVFLLAAFCCCLWGAAYPSIKGDTSFSPLRLRMFRQS